jgi:hypothetical protein
MPWAGERDRPEAAFWVVRGGPFRLRSTGRVPDSNVVRSGAGRGAERFDSEPVWRCWRISSGRARLCGEGPCLTSPARPPADAASWKPERVRLESAHMSAQNVALISRCAECEAAWLPSDEDRWRAYLGGADLDELADVIFYCSDCAEREFGQA